MIVIKSGSMPSQSATELDRGFTFDNPLLGSRKVSVEDGRRGEGKDDQLRHTSHI